nr:SGNH hydrolase-type esterase domain-containing protein [Tanacetum cinerariifolium]
KVFNLGLLLALYLVVQRATLHPSGERCLAYEENKNRWIYKWNKDVLWVANMPWVDYGPWIEPKDDTEHSCTPFHFKNGLTKWPTCKWTYEWYENLEEGKLKDESLNYKGMVEASMNMRLESCNDSRSHCSPLDEWEDFKSTNHMETNVNYNHYLEVKENVIATWLVWSYKKQFEEYMELKKQLEVYKLYTDVLRDPSNAKFSNWLASKFDDHMTMDWYMKNVLWLYWKRGDDEELSDLEEENLNYTKIAKIFRIETNIFDFETPLCKAYEENKNRWIYKWNKDVLWVANMPWVDYGPWIEPHGHTN